MTETFLRLVVKSFVVLIFNSFVSVMSIIKMYHYLDKIKSKSPVYAPQLIKTLYYPSLLMQHTLIATTSLYSKPKFRPSSAMYNTYVT